MAISEGFRRLILIVYTYSPTPMYLTNKNCFRLIDKAFDHGKVQYLDSSIHTINDDLVF